MSHIITGADGRHYLIEAGTVMAMDTAVDSPLRELMPPGDDSFDIDSSLTLFKPPGEQASSATMWLLTDPSVPAYKA